jgi:dipeptidyl aminopeptidase/acylaminoacyl peptidase
MRATFALLCLALLAAGALTPRGAAAAAAGKARSPAAAPKPFSVQDLVQLDRIAELAAAPDGRHIAYTLRSAAGEANGVRTGIWLLDTRKRNALPLRITDLEAMARAPEWGADGRQLYYLSDRGGSMQVWRSDAGGAQPTQITNLPLDVGSFRVAPNGDRLVVSLEVFRDCADLDCTKLRLKESAHRAAHGLVFDSLFVRHWNEWSDQRRSQLYSIPLDAAGIAAGAPVSLTAGIDGDVPAKPFGTRADYAISPDGLQVAFSVRTVPGGEAWSTNFDIYLVAAGGGTPRNLTAENPAWDGQPAFAPNGATLAYLATDRPGAESDRFHLVLLDLNSGAKRPLTQNWDRSIVAFAWARDGKTLFATTDHLGQRPLWAIDGVTGRAAAITGNGHVERFGVGAQKVFYVRSDLAHPGDVYAVGFGGGEAQKLTHLNEPELAARRLGEFEQFSFAGWHGENVFGYVVKPVNFKRDHKYPVAFVVHGGPESSLANLWHWRWNAQAIAGAGYAVVLIDFHGSTGYGQAFTDSIMDDWGGKPLEDLKLGLAAALKQYPWLDSDRMCALGGSFGGYLVNWIASQWPDRFKCLVSHDGVFDNRSMYYSTEELWFPEWEFGGPEYSNPAAYARQNPIDGVALWKTPTLVIHGELDYRVPDSQGLATFTALQRHGVPSRLLYFPDENHWVLKPANSIQWYETVLDWMKRWTGP